MKSDNRTDGVSVRDSSLTFAVIWDPENGLEAFSSAQLFETPADISIAGHDFDCWSDESHSVQSEEPFAVFGSRQLHFIDIRSSNMYKNIIEPKLNYEPPSPSSASSYSLDSWRSSCCVTSETAVKTLSQDSFFIQGPGRKAPADSAVKAERYSMLIFKKPDVVDDEGFFDVSSHADCDPHLPSRFSMSTTSTSAYVAVDRSVSGPATPMGLFHKSRLVLNTTDALVAESKFRPRKFPRGESLSPTSRLSKLLPPWLKRPQRDERWVLIDIRPMILERVVDDD